MAIYLFIDNRNNQEITREWIDESPSSDVINSGDMDYLMESRISQTVELISANHNVPCEEIIYGHIEGFEEV